MENTTFGWTNTTSGDMTYGNLSISENTTTLPDQNETVFTHDNIRVSAGLLYTSYLIMPLFLIAGICGNTLTLIVSRCKEFRSTFHGILIAAIAVADMVHLLTIHFSDRSVHDLFGRDIRAISVIGCRLYLIVFRGARMISSHLIILICLERFLLLWFPLKARILTTKRTALVAVSCLFVATATFNTAWSTFGGVARDTCLPVVVSAKDKQLARVFGIIAMTLRSFIPACILVCFTPLTVIKLYKQRKARRQMGSKSSASQSGAPDETYRAYLMLVSVVVAYMGLVTPFCVTKHVLMLHGIDITSMPVLWMRNLYQVSMICEAANCVVNFFLYALLNTSFRQRFVAVVLPCKRTGTQRGLSGKPSVSD